MADLNSYLVKLVVGQLHFEKKTSTQSGRPQISAMLRLEIIDYGIIICAIARA